jgi:exosortase/archaeosortase family protein
MVNLSVILALILPAKLWVKSISFGLAPSIGFIVNALRVALLTFLISRSNMTAFHYWHDNPNASSIFFLIAATLLLVFYYGCLQYLNGKFVPLAETVQPESIGNNQA